MTRNPVATDEDHLSRVTQTKSRHFFGPSLTQTPGPLEVSVSAPTPHQNKKKRKLLFNKRWDIITTSFKSKKERWKDLLRGGEP